MGYASFSFLVVKGNRISLCLVLSLISWLLLYYIIFCHTILTIPRERDLALRFEEISRQITVNRTALSPHSAIGTDSSDGPSNSHNQYLQVGR